MADQRLAVIECIRTVLEQASGQRPLLIALDDVQWADSATLLALGSLPVQLFSYPIAWVLARRLLPASAQLQGAIGRLAEAGAGRLHLGPLDTAAAVALAADSLGVSPDTDVAALVARAEGNPFYLSLLLQSAGDAAGPSAAKDPADCQPGRLPATLRSAVAAHLRSLPDPAKDLLKVASVLGREFTVAELAAVTSQPASQLMPALEQALTAEVLTEHGDRLAFRHDLLREGVYDDIPAPMRPVLHRDAAVALRSTGAPLARVAAQYSIGARPGDEEAIEVLTAAAAQLSTTAREAAADLAVRALGLLADGDPRQAAMTVTAVEWLGWAARQEEARSLGEAYLASHRPPPEVEADILLSIRWAWIATRTRPYPSPLPPGVLGNPAVPARIRANLIAFEQIGPMFAGDYATADQGFATAMRLMTDSGDAGDTTGLLCMWVFGTWMRGDLSAALDRTRANFAAHGGESEVSAAVFRYDIGRTLGAVGRTREALAAIELALQDAEASASVSFKCRHRRAVLLSDQGRLDDARAEARAAAAEAEAAGFPELMTDCLAVLTETSVRQGDLAEAQAAAARHLPDAGDSTRSSAWHWAQALYLDAQGRPGPALEVLKPMFAELRRGCLIFVALQPARLPLITALALRAGDRQRATEAAAAAATIAQRSPGMGVLAGIAAHARGLLAGDRDELQQAVDLLAGSEWPLALAAAREDLGGVLARHGAREQAAAELEAAYQAYLDAGADRDNARIRGILRQLGIRKRRPVVARPDHGWASLTAAELAVAQIVAEGRTNRETAAQLYLSADTVNTHLRHAFAKLDIHSRVELARLVLSGPPDLPSGSW
jgi:DNA-binding CsgD family transcriptional regulator